MLYIPFPFKRCSKCRQYKWPVEFCMDKSRTDGLFRHCKECVATYHAGYYKKNKKHINQTSQKWFDAHPGYRLEKGREDYKNKHQEALDKAARWRNKNPEKRKVATRKWNREHPERNRHYRMQRIMRSKNLPNDFTLQEWQVALDYWQHTCAYCLRALPEDSLFAKEHFIPISSGGGYTKNNIVPACKACNSSKKDSEPGKWLARKFSADQAEAILKRIQDYFEWVKR